ncbi:FAD/NAD(P)-binding [Gracilaria domingensis]|nr:FAD/NAD(P)-binding [Gracilaria domingensis]
MENDGPTVLVVGGGPAGLIFATSLHTFLPSAQITVFDRRWHNTAGTVQWRGRQENVNRRDQVVTIQSAVFSLLPDPVLRAIFPPDGYSEVWPLSQESPITFPRNLRIRDIEDRLLNLALEQQLTLVPMHVRPEDFDFRNPDNPSLPSPITDLPDLVVFANGPSRSRSFSGHFHSKFGLGDHVPYSLSDSHLEDAVLALQVETSIPQADAVILTLAQNRFLLNTTNGKGYLYMRLTEQERTEVKGLPASGRTFVPCIQSEPCLMRYNGERFRCDQHHTVFVPPIDQLSLLWPRVKQGMQLFKCRVSAVTAFQLSMVRSPAFVAELTDTGIERQVFAALIGDAANSIHFWPGRGLNQGICSAVALARCLHNSWRPCRRLRSADFTPFVAAMSSLQHRHKDRAWRAMVQVQNGVVKPIRTIIEEAIAASTARTRDELIELFMERVVYLTNRLHRRMPEAADVHRIRRIVVENATQEAMSVFVHAGAWDLRLSAGPEVDIDSLVPLPRNQDSRNPSSSSSVEPPSEGSDSTRLRTLGVDPLCYAGILSDLSIRESFDLALRFGTPKTLAWVDARRELRAILVRAGRSHLITDEDITSAIQEADVETPDRIEREEFVQAMHILLRRRNIARQLPHVWRQRFENAAGLDGMVAREQAVFHICTFGIRSGATMADRLEDTANVAQMFPTPGDVSLEVYLDVARRVMYGEY